MMRATRKKMKNITKTKLLRKIEKAKGLSLFTERLGHASTWERINEATAKELIMGNKIKQVDLTLSRNNMTMTLVAKIQEQIQRQYKQLSLF